MPLGPRLKQLREDRRLSLTEVSARTGISRGYLFELEKGTYANPSKKVCTSLSKLYGVPLEQLFEAPDGDLPRHLTEEALSELSHKLTASQLQLIVDLMRSFAAANGYDAPVLVVQQYRRSA